MARRPSKESYVSNCTKYTLFIFNFVFWIAGIGCIAFGTYAQLQKATEVSSALDFLFNPAFLIITIGCLIFVITFFGCLGALRENTCLLKAFHILLTIVLVLQVLAVALVFIFFYVPSVRDKLKFLNPEGVLKEAIERYRDDLDLRDTIDSMQTFFECCGVSNDDQGYEDWNTNIYFNCTASSLSAEKCGVPYSCCKEQKVAGATLVNHQCGYNVRDSTITPVSEIANIIYVQGCVKGFGSWLEENIFIIAGVALGIIIPQIIGICMARNLEDQVTAQLKRIGSR